MDEDNRELVCRLFVVATEKLEEAHEIAVAGQASRLSARKYAGRVGTLVQLAEEVGAIAGVIKAITRAKI